ncbi:MAG: fibronectin type III domain-containing protein [Acidobacteria bacterium]|nr:fibronectin type III domain-containing protein [Acidobacteriota bacterium]
MNRRGIRRNRTSLGPASRWLGGAIAVVLLVGSGSLVPSPAWADSAIALHGALPSGRVSAGAIWDASNAYIFGGDDGISYLDQIVRYNPATNTTTTMSATLPWANFSMSAIWDGSNAYMFGGLGAAGNRIVRYNPAADTVTVMGATLPSARSDTSAIWDGNNAYIFGGGATAHQIVRYNPAADTVSVMSATLPTGRYATSAVWDGNNAYIFGGSHLNQIVRYTPATDTVEVMPDTLPSGRSWTGAIWDGSNAYIFGGEGGSLLDEVVRYTPSTHTVTLIATLPSARSGASAIFDGANAYIFGGWTGSSSLNEILRYDFATHTVANMNAVLPSARSYPSAIWDRSNVYLFGGRNGDLRLDEIVRYSPTTGRTTTMGARLPSGRAATSAIFDGGDAYIFGGYDGAAHLNQIVRYTPATDTVHVMNATLPAGLSATSAIWDGDNAYIFGGSYIIQPEWGTFYSDLIVRYTPATDTVTTMAARLPWGRGYTSAIWDGANAYIFGGYDGSNRLNQIVRYIPATDEAAAVAATLPSDRGYTSAIWDGNSAYIFGGMGSYFESHAYWDQIVRYTPATGMVATMGGTLPTGRLGTGAIWDGSNAYIFGGVQTYYPPFLNEIVRYSLAPGAPQSPAASPGSAAGQISLTWSPPPTNSHSYPITEYRIFRATTPGSEVLLTQLGNVGTYTDSGLTPGTRYYYRVAAVDAVWVGVMSAEVSAVPLSPPDAPAGLTATPGQGQIALSWTAPAFDGGSVITEYRLYRGTAPGSETLQGALLPGATSFTDTSLGNGATFYYEVTAVNAVGESAFSNEASATTWNVPSLPQNPTANAGPGVGEISLAWTAPSSDGGSTLSGYKLYRGTGPGGGTLLTTLPPGTTSFTDAGLGNGATRFYSVSATNVVGESPRSAEVSAQTFTTPSAPTLAAAAGPGVSEISLSWTAPSSGGTPITGYRLYRGTAPGSETLLATLGVMTTYTDVGLPNGATRHYKVAAVNLAGEGPASNEASATTFNLASAPLSLTATAGANQISLSWTAPASNGGTPITGYTIYRGTAPGAEAPLATVDADVTTYTDSGLPNGAARYYRVAASNVVGEGALSAGASATTFDVPAAPTALSATTGSGQGQIALSWIAPASTGGTPVTGYKIYRGTSSGTETFLVQVGGAQTSYTDSGLGDGATRYYKVSALNSMGESPQSNESSATTIAPPGAPRNLSVQPGTSLGQIVLTWSPPASTGGAPLTGYRIYRGTSSGNLTYYDQIGDSTSYTDGGAQIATNYHYRVSAVNPLEGPQSGEACNRAFPWVGLIGCPGGV